MTLVVTAYDGQGGEAQQSMVLRIDPGNTDAPTKAPGNKGLSPNRPPAGNKVGTLRLDEGMYADLDLSRAFWDADGDELRFSIEGLPSDSGLSMSASGILSGIPKVVRFSLRFVLVLLVYEL